MAGLEEVPAVIRELTDREAAELAMIENLQREDLNPMEEAKGYQTLMETYGMTQEEAARAVNKSRPAVANALRLLQLPDEVAEMVAGGPPVRGPCPGGAVLFRGGAPARRTGGGGKRPNRPGAGAPRQSGPRAEKKNSPATAFSRDSFYHEVELALTEQMGRRVRVSEKNGGGLLQIEFYDQEDLRSLANRLSPEMEP